ncbi:NUDIX hydrolase [Candidatus Nomurabacteria bacterium]|nr:NUDIX hydrolase [Candidatus Nomurabacteria bacterium]
MDIPEFGIKRENEERRDGGCGVVFDPATQLYAVGEDEIGRLRLFSGGVNPGEDIKDGVLREVREESGLYDFEYVEKIAEALCHFHNTLKNVDRVAYATCFLVILKSAKLVPTELEEHEKFVLVWKTPEEIMKDWELRNGQKDLDHWVYFFKKSIERIKELGYIK